MEKEHEWEVISLWEEIDWLRELEVYKEKYLALKKIFDELEKSSNFKDKEIDLIRWEYELKMNSLETHKENEYRSLSQDYEDLKVWTT